MSQCTHFADASNDQCPLDWHTCRVSGTHYVLNCRKCDYYWRTDCEHLPAGLNHYAGGPLRRQCDECLDGHPKLRYDLIPEPALTAMAHAFTVGTKHGDGIKVESFAAEYAAIMRHLEACRRGETVDPDDGHLHLGAVMARCAKLIATGTKWEGE